MILLYLSTESGLQYQYLIPQHLLHFQVHLIPVHLIYYLKYLKILLHRFGNILSLYFNRFLLNFMPKILIFSQGYLCESCTPTRDFVHIHKYPTLGSMLNLFGCLCKFRFRSKRPRNHKCIPYLNFRHKSGIHHLKSKATSACRQIFELWVDVCWWDYC